MNYNGIRSSHTFILALGAIVALTMGLLARTTSANNSGNWMAPASANSVKNPVATSPVSIQEGKKIYTKECTSCHGTKGHGDGPKAGDLNKKPSDLVSHQVQAQSDGAIFWKITNGNKPMPTFRTAYSDQERWSVVNYLRTLGK